MILVENNTDWSGKQGVYLIRNEANGKCYVGSAYVAYSVRSGYNRRIRCLSIRLKEHRTNLEKGRHTNPYLQAAWNKSGADQFKFYVLEEVENADLLIEREQFWIDSLKAFGGGYNLRPTAGSNRGYKWTEERRERQSGSNHHMFGQSHTEESRQKISESGKRRFEREQHPMLGKKMSEAFRKRNSELKMGNKNNLGTKWTSEMKQAMSEIKSGKPIKHRSSASSQYKGVFFDARSRKWEVGIWYQDKRVYVGKFEDEKEAALQYNKAALKLFGSSAILNEIAE